ncbi:hypothetical protein [Tabrizicola sp.]|uniref:hypothetical protein n=1 Tax=Tabrizicola sp. TaxID=2005166 RepID=UPI002734DFFA|nr:hypothetical protein [Tabrizicola sp.]MDP3193994.1 hypothetical protein [Tabrizicola sp.]
MTRGADIARLVDLAQLVLDQRLGRLRSTAAELERSRQQIAALDLSAAPTDLEPVTAEKVALTYNRWADQRRSELNLVIARQTVDWMESRSEAQTAFGRMQALQGLATRLKHGR